MRDGKWKMKNGKWKTKNGEWQRKTADGRSALTALTTDTDWMAQ